MTNSSSITGNTFSRRGAGWGEDALRTTVAATTHDLSNALGAVLNYATFLAEDLAGTGAAAEYLPHLQSAPQRALDLVAVLAAALAPDAEGD